MPEFNITPRVSLEGEITKENIQAENKAEAIEKAESLNNDEDYDIIPELCGWAFLLDETEDEEVGE